MADLSGYSPIYVRSNGNDSTGDGTSNSPYLTAQKAFEIAYAGSGNKVLDFGVGSFGRVNLNTANASNWPSRIAVRGAGSSSSFLGGINGRGKTVSGEINGKNISIISNNTINLGDIISAGGFDSDGGYPGNGGNVNLIDCITEDIYCKGEIGNDGGAAGSVTIINTIARNIDCSGAWGTDGVNGNGGLVTLTNSFFKIIDVAGVASGQGPTSGPASSSGSVIDNGGNTGYWNNAYRILSVSTTLNKNGTGIWQNNFYRNGSLVCAVANIGSTIYVSVNGSDTNNGSSNNPLRSAQAAFEMAYYTTGNKVLNFGVGNFNGVNLNVAEASSWPSRINIAGAGSVNSSLGGINANGQNLSLNNRSGFTGIAAFYNGYIITALPGKNIDLTSDSSINLGNISANGGNIIAENTINNTGVSGGQISLTNCITGNINCDGGSGSPGGDNYIGGNGGSISLTQCIANTISCIGQVGAYDYNFGDGGSVTITSSFFDNISVAGSVPGSITDNGNNTGYWSGTYYVSSTPTPLNSNGNGVWSNDYYAGGVFRFSVPSTIYVRSTGSDSTGDASYNDPIVSSQFAFELAYGSLGDRVIDLGDGNFGVINLNAANASEWPSRISIYGIGTSILDGIEASGNDAIFDYDYYVLVSSPTNGKNLNILSNRVNLGYINSNGGSAEAYDGEFSGENAGNGGIVTITNSILENISMHGGNAFENYPGNGGNLNLIDSSCKNIINISHGIGDGSVGLSGNATIIGHCIPPNTIIGNVDASQMIKGRGVNSSLLGVL